MTTHSPCRLRSAGYLDALADNYMQRFETVALIVFEVNRLFPGLTRYNVDTAIRKATYELDLDVLNVPVVTLEHAYKHLGGSYWNY